jgi:hypothetical protein
MDRLHRGREPHQHPGVQGVGLREDASRAREVADLTRVDADRRQALVGQVTQDPQLVPAGGLQDDAGRGSSGERTREGPVARGLVGELLDGFIDHEGDIERVL